MAHRTCYYDGIMTGAFQPPVGKFKAVWLKRFPKGDGRKFGRPNNSLTCHKNVRQRLQFFKSFLHMFTSSIVAIQSLHLQIAVEAC